MQGKRGNWGSKMGFILAAAGSAVGLGNIWKFPYIAGENGGGVFVLFYLACIALVGLPIMVSEVLMGRAAQSSPVVAFRDLAGKGSPWVLTGWLGVASGFTILSFYSVVAGWTMHYVVLSLSGTFSGMEPEAISGVFVGLFKSQGLNLGYHALFMTMTIGIVFFGVQKGIERTAQVLMPALVIMLIGLCLYCTTLPGFGQALTFMFAPNMAKFKPASVLVAMGHAFFTLSLGMGAMLTYGSYLSKETGIIKTSIWVAVLDTVVALLASMVIFPIIFSSGLPAGAGPGLVFQSIPIAFSQMPGGQVLCLIFFLLLVLAALTSSISLLEVVTSSFIDLFGWRRRPVSVVTGGITFLFGIPSALSGDGFFKQGMIDAFGKSFFDWADHIASNWMLPFGGLFIAIFVGYVLNRDRRKDEFLHGTTWGGSYETWLTLLRYLVPLAVVGVFAKSSGLLKMLGLDL